MSGVTDACDLVDRTPLTVWSSTPKPTVHREDPATSVSGGSLLCQIRFTSTSATNGVTTNEAGMNLQVEFTGAGGTPMYDEWKHDDTAQTLGWNSGDLTGLGAQSYWRAGATTETGPAATYLVGAQESNVSVRVEVAVHRAIGDSPVDQDELAAIGKSEARMALDRLRKN